MREDPPFDSLHLAVEQRHHLVIEIGVKRLVEAVVHLLLQMLHSKGAERYSLLNVCRAHSLRPNANTDDEERAEGVRAGTPG
jgi:hypothetical protein